MPIFTYVCNKCGTRFDVLEGVNQQAPEKKCTKCAGTDIKKVFSGFNVGMPSVKMPPSCGGVGCPSSGGMCGGCPGAM